MSQYINTAVYREGTSWFLHSLYTINPVHNMPCSSVFPTYSIGVGRCTDLGEGGGRHFFQFKQQKCNFLEEQCLHAIPSTILQ